MKRNEATRNAKPLPPQTAEKTPARSGWSGPGVRGRLVASLGGIVVLTLVAIGIAVMAFDRVGSRFADFNTVQLPAMVDAGELAIHSTEVTIASSRLIGAGNEAERQAAFADLSKAVDTLVERAGANDTTGASGPTVIALQKTVDGFRERLNDLDNLTARNIALSAQRSAEFEHLFSLYDGMSSALTPLADKAYNELTKGGEAAGAEAGNIVDKLANDDMTTFRLMLTLRNEVNAITGATSSYLLVGDPQIAGTYRDLMSSAKDRVTLVAADLKKKGRLPEIEAEIAKLANQPAAALAMRQDVAFYRDSQSVRDFLSNLVGLQAAIDRVLVERIDDTLFDMTMNAEKAAGRNKSLIGDLMNNQVSKLKTTLETVSALREFAALLVQGALATDAAVIGPIQDKATAITDNLVQSISIIGDSDAMAKLQELRVFSDRQTGLIALRKQQLDVIAKVNGIVGRVFADTVDINRMIRDVVSARRDGIAQSSAELESELNRSAYFLIGLGAAVLLAALAIGALVVNRGIVKPLSRLIASTRALAGGSLDAEIGYLDRKDEMGQLAAALLVFRQNAIEKKRMEEIASGARAESEQERATREAIRAEEAARIKEAVDALGAGLHRLSEGDVSTRIEDPFIESLEGLRADFNDSLEKLQWTLLQVAENTHAIRGNSAELRGGADNLSRRTEQQAAALEETAAALDEITATVRSSAERATAASQLVGEARDSARASSDVVRNAVDAMARIEDASAQIGKIIGVIDEIAFQTNLLALNAGVEAARAGEAGRGFAVVAQEVRELAGRAASAAKEIKTLIGRSGTEVEAGVTLVRTTGDAIATIESYVARINEHVASIAVATREQATGLQEINAAVNQMDQTTQQNAAMVEETSAATHTLAEQADMLMALVGQFRLEGSQAERGHNGAALAA